ncbi:MAG: histidine phosphatase family protein [Acidobacteria bacterium]|nr:histidine phosphatase family protein [Acidobacteriota bacterium]
MGEIIRKNQFKINSIVSSPAKRAKQTALLVKEAGQINSEIEFDERIYEASTRRLLKIVSEINDKAESVMLIGHNPGFEGLLKFLTGETHSMPTAALAVIDLKIDEWNKAVANSGSLRILLRPKEEMKSFDAN